MTAREEAADEMKAAMAKLGKAMFAALAGPTATEDALDNIADPTVTSLTAAGLAIDAAAGAGALPDATNPDSVTLEAGDSAGSLGGWMGTHYAHTAGTGASKVSNAAVVYDNKGPGKRVAFADAGHTIITTDGPTKGMVLVETADLANVMADAFTHSGTQSHPQPDRSDALYVRGTYDGAPGEYRCTPDGGTGCSSTNDGKGSPSALTGIWHFKPDAGAMVHQPDATYLYYGWWVRKDSDDMPTAASAFRGVVAADQPAADALRSGSGADLTGSATYSGHATGKFAMSNVLTGTGNAGHFTADAMLEATFGDPASVTGAGITGTIDNFMLNDSESVDWSVSLHRAGWDPDGLISGPDDDGATPDIDEELGTTWSIDGNSGGRSGTWSAQMYDEMPGNPGDDPPGDGSNIPTTVTGTFYSEFSTIGRMVGAFGADKEE